MSQILNLLLQHKDMIFIVIIAILLIIIAGKKNVKVFVENNLKTLEEEVLNAITKNPTLYATIIYSKLPVGLKAFATVATIEKIVSAFLDK